MTIVYYCDFSMIIYSQEFICKISMRSCMELIIKWYKWWFGFSFISASYLKTYLVNVLNKMSLAKFDWHKYWKLYYM